MKFKSLLSVLIILATTSSCLKVKPIFEEEFDRFDGSMSKALKAECEAVNTDEDIKPLWSNITKELGNLDRSRVTEDKTPDELQAMISNSLSRIQSNSYEIYTTAKDQFIEDKFDHLIHWKIDKTDFKDSEPTWNDTFRILQVKVDKVYYLGMDVGGFKDRITISRDVYAFYINFHDEKGRSLSICMLQKTLGILVDVKYKDGDEIKTEKLLLNTSNQLALTSKEN
jgi:hypothetical protein